MPLTRYALPTSANGPKRLLTTVGFSTPFALSLSKGQAELVEAFLPHDKGFDRLSPNGTLLSERGQNAASFDTSGRSEQPPQPERFCCGP